MNSIGIYVIRNKENEKIYIGSAKNIEKRKRQHISALRNNKHHSIHLQNHVIKYGLDNIYFEVLEYCKIEELIDLEQYFINTYSPEFNTCKIAGSRAGCKHSEETKKKIGAKSKGRKFSKETIDKLKFRMIGFRHSDDAKNKLSAKLTGNRNGSGVVFTDERRNKIRLAKIGKKPTQAALKNLSESHKDKRKVIQCCECGYIIKVWNGQYDVYNNLRLNRKNLYLALNGKKEKYKGFRWSYQP